MPELPEVQTVVSTLQKVKNYTIKDFSYSWEKVIYNLSPSKALNILKNKTINKISRKGKYIILHLDNTYLICHLRMTGYLYSSNTIPENSKHVRCYFTLSDNKYLIYEDIRKFGGFYIYKNINNLFSRIGVDPFEKKFTEKWLLEGLKSRKRIIKNLLLDQSYICGLGNIYIDEILWHSKIKPTRLSHMIPKYKIKLLHQYTLSILSDSIKHHGTTIINFKFDNMKTGDYKNNLVVYSRDGQPCIECKSNIIKRKIAGRSTHFCKKCQN